MFKSILIDSNPLVTGWHSWSFILVLTAPNTSHFDLKVDVMKNSRKPWVILKMAVREKTMLFEGERVR